MCSVPTAKPNTDFLQAWYRPCIPLKPAPPEPAFFVRFRVAGRLPLIIRRGPERCLSYSSRARAAPATPACPFRTKPIASQAPPSRGWHVALYRSAPLLPTSIAVRAACRAAEAVSLRSTPPFTPFAGAHLRSGPPSYDAEGGTGSGYPATSALQSHPQKRPFWWMNSYFAFAIHENGLYGG